MKFKVNTPDLLAALDLASVIIPKPMTPQGGAGYLFVVRGEKCLIYSRDTLCVARAEFAISEVEGEGSFVYPTAHVDALRYVGDTCSFEALEEDEKFIVRYSSENGAVSERTSVDPALFTTCDSDFEEAEAPYDFPSGILREAISLSRPFLAKANDTTKEEQFKALQVFDKALKPEYAKGDGYLFAADSVRAFYFYCEAFEGKGLEIHGQHLPALVAFLGKSGEGVKIRIGKHFVFASNTKGHVLGWPKHAKSHAKFAYYPLKSDVFVFSISKSELLKALKYTRVELDTTRDKIKFHFDHEKSQVRFAISEGTSKAQSFPVAVTVVQKKDENWSFDVNIDHMLTLVEDVKAPRVQLRVLVVAAASKEVAMFRTVDEFKLDAGGKLTTDPEGAFQCRVTRFMPSKN